MYSKESSIKRKTENHLKQMKHVARDNGHLIPHLFWDMYANLPLTKQKAYLERAKAMAEQADSAQIEHTRPLT